MMTVSSKSLLLTLAFVGCLALPDRPTSALINRDDRPSEPTASPALSVVSEDPYMNPGTYHRTQVEPDTAAFGSTIVSVFQSGRSYNWGASNIGWSMSSDAGATWTDGFLPGTTIHATPPGRWQRVTDPAIAYDSRHDTWLIVGEGARPCSFSGSCAGARVFVSRSTNGAQTFSDPILPTRPNRTQFFDVPWVACDNFPASSFYGNCYMVWADGWHDALLYGSTSSDGGLTWAAATIKPNYHCVEHPIPVVQPNGTVVVAFIEGCSGSYKRQTFISTDGGASYGGPFDIAARDGRFPGGGFRTIGTVSVDVDAAGTIYAAWADCYFRPPRIEGRRCGTHNDIAYSTSQDGRQWTDVVRVPIDPITSSVDHFLPALAVDPETTGSSTHIGIVYYFYPEQVCGPRTCQPSVGFVSSIDGGATWKVQELAGPFMNTWFPLTDSGYMVGEYIGLSFVDEKAVAVFPVAAEGDCELGDLTSCNAWIASATISLAS
jgi:hypothetical protein